MMKRNKEKITKEELQQNVEVTDNEQEVAKESKWAKLKEESKAIYNEIVVDIKNPIKRMVYRRKISNKAVAILRAFIFFGLSFVILFPIFKELSQSFMNPIDYSNPYVTYIPQKPTIVNYRVATLLLGYWESLLNTLKLSVLTTLCQLFATSLAGYAFARLKFKGSNLIFWLVMLTLIVPPQAVALARTFYLQDFDILAFGDNPGLFESLLGHTLKLSGEGKESVFYITSITGQGIRAALFVYLFRQFFRGIPIELEESAQIDGAGIVRTFWSVMLPNARGIITTVALFAFVWQWNDSYFAGMYKVSTEEVFPLLTRKLLSVSEKIGTIMNDKKFESFVASVSQNLGKNTQFQSAIVSTAALMMMAPLLIGYLFVQRLFIEGVERSGIVG